MQPIVPEPGSFLARAMARGEPGIPRRFVCCGRRYEVAEVLGPAERETGPCRNGSGERYVRRHVTRVRTTAGEVLLLSGSRGAGGPRWVLRAVEASAPHVSPPTVPGA